MSTIVETLPAPPMDSDSASKVVLRESVTRDDIDAASCRCGWHMTNVFPGSDSHPGQVVYATRDRRSWLYLVEDPRLGVLYFTGSGPTIEQALAEVRTELPSVTPKDALASTRSCTDPARYRRALAAIVLAAGAQPSEECVLAVRDGLDHSDPAVRHAALVATTYAPWPELRTRVAQLAAGDADATVRSNAARVLSALYDGAP